ncbi:(Fe-S)-binding protein [Saccharopolyspora erythraea]|uniref:(Fe-S)-binding protein n=1 Tax=Saccharopolyspora erythraea TaxID=1836 RepID=UPI002013A391|nr:(Fe-S)-binding protein [Saccharopolyspora erythraea]
MSPGVVVRPRPVDADLRVRPRRELDITPVFSYENDGGDLAATLRRCVGVGKCRTRDSAGVMCPSFQVTHDEKDSTRGRARVLDEMLNGGVIEDGWRSAEVSFSSWFRRRTAPAGAGTRGTMLLWVDSFGNALNPGPLRAATEVLEEIGFRVIVPPGTQCCGLTWITTGQLGVARRVQRRTLNAIAPQLEEVSAVVGIEPSCTATLRTDLPDLLAGHPAAARLARKTKTFAGTIRDLAPDWDPPELPVETLRQTHCHQHAVMGDQADSWLLERMGVDDTKLGSGCCGLAGNFGFEREHYALSVAAGNGCCCRPCGPPRTRCACWPTASAATPRSDRERTGTRSTWPNWFVTPRPQLSPSR